MAKYDNVIAEVRYIPNGHMTPAARDALVLWLESKVLPELKRSTCGQFDFQQPQRIHRFKLVH